MRVLTLCAIALVLTGCNTVPPQTTPTFAPSAAQTAPLAFRIIPVDVDARFINPRKPVNVDGAAASGAVALVFASSIEQSRQRRALAIGTFIREITADIDLDSYFWKPIAAMSVGDRWQLLGLAPPISSDDIDASVRSALEDPATDVVLVLKRHLWMTSIADQLQIGVTQQVFTRESRENAQGALKPVKSADYFVFPPKNPVVPRAYTEEERAALEAQYRAEAAAALEEDSANRMRIALRLDKQLAEVEEMDTIPFEDALIEAWTPELVAATLKEAEPVLLYMMRKDWDETRAYTVNSTEVARYSVDWKGGSLNGRGLVIDEFAGYTILIEKNGSLSALPRSDLRFPQPSAD